MMSKFVGALFLGPHCNMVCEFCVTENNIDSLTFHQALVILERLKKKKIDNLILGGGEPFLWNFPLLEFASLAKREGFFIQVGTNGTRLPHGFEFLTMIDRFILPLESFREEIHNSMRKYSNNHFQLICEKLKILNEVKKSTTISTVLTQKNKKDILELAQFIKTHFSNNLHAWHLYQFVPQGRGGTLASEKLLLPLNEYHEIVDQVRNLKLNFKIFRRTHMYQSKYVHFFWSQNGEIQEIP